MVHERRNYEELAKAIADELKNNTSTCALGIDPVELQEERRFVRDLMAIADRFDNIKWGFLGTVIRSVGLAALAIFVLGLGVYIKKKLGI